MPSQIFITSKDDLEQHIHTMFTKKQYLVFLNNSHKKLEEHSGAHVPPTKMFRRLTGSVNKTMLKALLAAAANRPTYTSDFPDVKLRV